MEPMQPNEVHKTQAQELEVQPIEIDKSISLIGRDKPAVEITDPLIPYRLLARIFTLLLALIAIGWLFGSSMTSKNVSAQSQSPQTQPTPPRGISEDLWADAVIGQPDFNTIAPNETVNNKITWANGVIVAKNASNSDANTLFIYDSGNNRILGVNVKTCLGIPGSANCQASLVIGQPSMRAAGCNRDSSFQQFPYRTDASADTLCGQPEHQVSLSEGASGASMAVDDQGRLWVVDYFNHRVLRYPQVFAPTVTTATSTPTGPTQTHTPTPTGPTHTATFTYTPIRADIVIGQLNALGTPDFTGNKCNGLAPNPLAIRNSKGDLVEQPITIPPPNSSSLCFNWTSGDSGGYEVLNNNWIAGVDVVPPTTTPGTGYVWVADSGNNRVLRFSFTRDANGVDIFTPTADRVLGQLTFESRVGGIDATHLVNPSVVRADRQTGKVYVIDQGFSIDTRTPLPGDNARKEYHRVQVFGPTIHPTGTPNVGTLLGYWHQPWGLNFDITKPDNLWISVNLDNRLEAWPIPTNAPTPFRGLILGGIGRPSGSIGIDDQYDTNNQYDQLFTSASNGGSIQLSDVFAFSVLKSPTMTLTPTRTKTPISTPTGTLPTSTPTAMGTPPTNTPTLTPPFISYTKSLFGYSDSNWGNKQTNRELAEGNGVAVSNNPTPQMFVAETDRILFWNNPTTSSGAILLTNGQEATGVLSYVFGVKDTYYTLKATRNFFYITTRDDFHSITRARVDIYRLPIPDDGHVAPVTSLYYPVDFKTIDTTPIPLENTRAVTLFLAPTTDDQFLWVGVVNDNRMLRVRNPIPIATTTPTGNTPTPTHTPVGNPYTPTRTPTKLPNVDVILGQTDAYNDGCNCQKVTAWISATYVITTNNTIEKNGGVAEMWDAGARSSNVITDPMTLSWDILKGYAQITVTQTNKLRAFGLKYDHTPIPTPGHNYQDIDFAFLLTGTNTLQVYERSRGIRYTGTYSITDRLRVALEATGGNPDYFYRVSYYKNDVNLISNDPFNVAITFPLYLKASIASSEGSISNAYLATSQRQIMTNDSLCLPGTASIDKQGNLWVSDHTLELQGNQRLLEFDADQFPISTTQVISGVAARRIYDPLANWEPAFDSQNRMVIGYSTYLSSSVPFFPYTPAPTLPPGTLTPEVDRYKGRFPGVYNNPLYSLTGTPTPVTAPTPNTMLRDFYSKAFAATFDQYDNLYMRDLNRGKVLIYSHPFYGTPVVWATPLANVIVSPTSNSMQKTAGTDGAWDAGAVSVQAIGVGDGYVLTTIEDRPPVPVTGGGPTSTPTATPMSGATPGPSVFDRRRAFGLSQASAVHAHRLQDLEYAFVLTATNSLLVYERGALVYDAGIYDYNDVLKVAVEGGLVKYYRNGILKYTSTQPVTSASYPLQLDTSIASTGGRIYNAHISGGNIVSCSAVGWCTGASTNKIDNPTPPATAVPYHSVLNGVAVIAPDNIWAVGSYYIPGQPTKSLIEKWNGTEWSIVPDAQLPTGIGTLHGISAYNANSIWAVGDSDVLRYENGTWSSDGAPDGGKGVAAVSGTEAWTVGSKIRHRYEINHVVYWETFDIPNGGLLNGITSVDSCRLWAVGYRGSSPHRTPITVYGACNSSGGYDWTDVTNPTLPGDPNARDGYFNSVDRYDKKNVWAVGSFLDPQINTYGTLTEFYDGATWTRVTGNNPGLSNHLNSVRVTREGDVWAVGDYQDTAANQIKTSILHWNDRTWEKASNPNPGFSNVLMGASTSVGSNAVISNTWVVGNYAPKDGAPLQTLVESLQAPLPPYTTTTYYETGVSASKHYDQGCAARLAKESGIIVLDYGQPRLWHPGPSTDIYGTLQIGSQNQAYIKDPNGGEDIRSAVEGFIDGYMASGCTPSFTNNPPHITVAIGTNNNNTANNAELTSAHAQEWADMVKNVYYYLVSKSYTSVVDVAAAIDAQPSWSAYGLVKDWMLAYSNQNVSDVYNFGSTGGYPKVPSGQPTPVVPPPWAYSAWDTDQLYQASWGIGGAKPLPSMFKAREARGWHRVASWAVETNSLPMKFSGEVSGRLLSSSNYDPQQAWQTLFHEMSSDPRAGIPQTMEWATDIKCSSGSPPSCKP